jgi:hypothetical protein
MNAVKPAGLKPCCNPLATNAGTHKLIERNHAVLARGNLCDQAVGSAIGAFRLHGYA